MLLRKWEVGEVKDQAREGPVRIAKCQSSLFSSGIPTNRPQFVPWRSCIQSQHRLTDRRKHGATAIRRGMDLEPGN